MGKTKLSPIGLGRKWAVAFATVFGLVWPQMYPAEPSSISETGFIITIYKVIERERKFFIRRPNFRSRHSKSFGHSVEKISKIQKLFGAVAARR